MDGPESQSSPIIEPLRIFTVQIVKTNLNRKARMERSVLKSQTVLMTHFGKRALPKKRVTARKALICTAIEQWERLTPLYTRIRACSWSKRVLTNKEGSPFNSIRTRGRKILSRTCTALGSGTFPDPHIYDGKIHAFSSQRSAVERINDEVIAAPLPLQRTAAHMTGIDLIIAGQFRKAAERAEHIV